jgi:hypothetical protein
VADLTSTGMKDPLMSGACEHPSTDLVSQGSSKLLSRVIWGKEQTRLVDVRRSERFWPP